MNKSSLQPLVTAHSIIYKAQFKNSYSNILLQELGRSSQRKESAARITGLVKGVLIWKKKLDWEIAHIAAGSIRIENRIRVFLQLGLYQLGYESSRPPHAVVNEVTEVVKRSEGKRTANFVNAVLRNYLRTKDEILYPQKKNDLLQYLAVTYSFPEWIAEKWCREFGRDDAEKLCRSSNLFSLPLPVRTNVQRITTGKLKSKLIHRGFACEEHKIVKDYLFISGNESIIALEEYKKGLFSIQDPSMGIPVEIVAKNGSGPIYDFCAAPGGKSTGIAERAAKGRMVISVDDKRNRLPLIAKEVKRLRLSNVFPVNGDSRTVSFRKKGTVLLDVPCSGLGVLRKKADLRWQKQASDIRGLVKIQRKLLMNAAGLVADGELLIYTTCTISKEENEDNIRYFLKSRPEFKLDDTFDSEYKGLFTNGTVLLLPFKNNTDGMFTAVLRKIRN